MPSIKEHKEWNTIAQLRKKRTIQAAIVAGAVALLVLVGGSLLALNSYVSKVDPDVICQNITIGVTDVSGMTKAEAMKALKTQEETDSSKTVTLKVSDQKVEMFLKEAGFKISDREKLVQKALNYGKTGNMLSRYKRLKGLEKEVYTIKESYEIDQKKLSAVCDEKIKPLLQSAQNAYITRDSKGKLNLVKEKEGERVDIEQTYAGIVEKLTPDWDHKGFEAEVVVKTGKPEIVADDLKDITDELGTFWTDAGGGERWTNLKTGSGKINGTILMPGETFSVYEATAPYDAEHGYAEGTAFENGEVVPSWGGGICQVSTTLYNAAIYAELEIVERHPHSMAVDYVKPSRDAAIFGKDMDFKFKNNYDTPIYICGDINEQNQLWFAIYGKDTRPKNRKVEYVSETLSYDDYTTVYQVNYDLYFGSMEYKGSPHSGIEAQLVKVVTVDDEEVSREVFNTSYYERSDQIVEVGVAGGSSWGVSALETAIASQDLDAIYSAINGEYDDGSDDYDEEYYDDDDY